MTLSYLSSKDSMFAECWRPLEVKWGQVTECGRRRIDVTPQQPPGLHRGKSKPLTHTSGSHDLLESSKSRCPKNSPTIVTIMSSVASVLSGSSIGVTDEPAVSALSASAVAAVCDPSCPGVMASSLLSAAASAREFLELRGHCSVVE